MLFPSALGSDATPTGVMTLAPTADILPSSTRSEMGHRAVLTVGRSVPVYPDKQTSSDPVGMSQTCTIPAVTPNGAVGLPHIAFLDTLRFNRAIFTSLG